MLEFTSCIVLYTRELSDEHPIQACICLFRSFHLDVSAGVLYRYLYLADVHVTIISLLYLFSQSIFLRSLFIFSVRRNKSEKQQLRVVCACSSHWLPPLTEWSYPVKVTRVVYTLFGIPSVSVISFSFIQLEIGANLTG